MAHTEDSIISEIVVLEIQLSKAAGDQNTMSRKRHEKDFVKACKGNNVYPLTLLCGRSKCKARYQHRSIYSGCGALEDYA
jgi:hypothetical protein